jgi:hypothetical protein
MNASNRIDPKTKKPDRVHQLHVRCDVRAGDDLATCQWNVAKWKGRYQEAYNEAKQRGCI